MTVATDTFTIHTQGMTDMHDITPEVTKAIGKSGLQNGTVTVFAPGSTAGITTTEFEPGLQKDIPEFMEKIVPYKADYCHHATWNDDNGASHIRSTMVGPSLVVPFVNGNMTLGTWQQITLLCFDTRPRKREIVVQLMGE